MTADSFRLIFRSILIRDEGFRLKPYTDTAGKLTIGVGRNLTDRGISQMTALQMLDEDIDETTQTAFEIFGELLFTSWSEPRRHAILCMVFNLGGFGFRKFTKMISAIKVGDWKTAGDEALDSVWAGQVGERAQRIVKMMRDEVYDYEL